MTELSHGATLIAPNRTRFQFWAPDIAALEAVPDSAAAAQQAPAQPVPPPAPPAGAPGQFPTA